MLEGDSERPIEIADASAQSDSASGDADLRDLKPMIGCKCLNSMNVLEICAVVCRYISTR
jgi:hypothetical protein